MNTSATGGPLLPIDAAPIYGKPLNDFFHDLIVSLTGLDPIVVYPSWQAEPPNIPDAFKAWAAFGVMVVPSDDFPAVVHDGAGSGTSALHRHEMLELRVSFYDTGTDGSAEDNASLLRDNLIIGQNRDVLRANSMGLVDTGDIVTVPSLLKTRWLYRCDLAMRVRREVVRTYAVESLLTLDATLKTGAQTVPIS